MAVAAPLDLTDMEMDGAVERVKIHAAGVATSMAAIHGGKWEVTIDKDYVMFLKKSASG